MPGGLTASNGAAPRGKLSPAAKRVAEENKVDPKAVAGSGRDGRVSKSDVVNYLSEGCRSAARAGAVRQPAVPRAAGLDRARCPRRSARADDPAAGAHRRAHGAGAVDSGVADLVQRSRLEGGQRIARPLQGAVREATRREARLHVVLHQGLRGGAEEVSRRSMPRSKATTSCITSTSMSAWPYRPIAV